MSAKVKPAAGGSGWTATCSPCNYVSHTGPSYLVDWWADVHNHINHKEES